MSAKIVWGGPLVIPVKGGRFFFVTAYAIIGPKQGVPDELMTQEARRRLKGLLGADALKRGRINYRYCRHDLGGSAVVALSVSTEVMDAEEKRA